MSCEETQQSLSSYLDDQLPLPVRAVCEAHLRQCPVCRAHVAELRDLSRSLARMARPVPPPDLADAINDALLIEAGARQRQPVLSPGVRFQRWLQPLLMPYSVGAITSVIIFFVMFSALRPHLQALRDWQISTKQSDEQAYKVLIYSTDEYGQPDITKPITPNGFAASRAPYGVESPSLNPRGALAALTVSPSHGHPGDDDMIVVTDVFSNGTAALADIVQPPRDRRMLDDFQEALRKNPAFVPASYDRRPQTMRVVFVLQKVDVNERNF